MKPKSSIFVLLMTKKYTHLSSGQRYQIEGFLKAGKSQAEIARLLLVDRSRICRELKRNTPKRGIGALVYNAEKAEQKTGDRHRFKNKQIRFTPEMKEYARGCMQEAHWSPELISAKGKVEFDDFICHETIYQWVWKSKKSNHRTMIEDKNLYQYLKHGKRRRKRGNIKENRGLIKERISIENRPEIINKRSRIGDHEADLVMGKNHQPGLLIVTDRKTRMNWIEKIENKEAAYIEGKLRKIIFRTSHKVRSITFDNDLAFANHYLLKKELNLKTYFTHPYTSQEKGTVENRIGVIRRFFPKKTDFKQVTAADVKRVEKLINDRPMRMFNYESPNEIYNKMMSLRC